MLKVSKVDKRSVAEAYGFEVGDTVLAFNGREAVDFIDCVYMDGEEVLDLDVLSKSGERIKLRVEKDPDEPLGLVFIDDSPIRRCKNKCAFCFVDQLPKGMRDTLYVKDDDWRYSLMCGNYVTLTNVTDEDIERICDYGISPLYVSVHAYDNEIRRRLVKNPNTDKLIEYMERLGRAGIRLHTQIVMCKGVNDGDVLRETIEKLGDMDYVETIAVVPVGLTAHREGLEKLYPVDVETARDAIKIAESFYDKGVKVWCSDETYIRAELDIPDYDYYESFLQIENGVGIVAKFRNDFQQRKKKKLSGSFGVVTGVSAEGEIKKASAELMKDNKKLDIEVYCIKNDYFGHTVTVAGLLTGIDVVNQLKGKNLPDTIVIPSVMLREQSDVTLDGMSVKQLEKELGRKIVVADSDGEGFARAFCKR